MKTTNVLGVLLAGVLTLGVVSGCGSGDENSGDGGTSNNSSSDGATPAECASTGKPEVVKLETDDGVTLEADLYLGGRANAAAAVLLHMVPPANDRSNYPKEFIEELTGRGITVLNVDRRGAGGSGGVAKEAYEGPNGKLDAKAAHDFLRAHACPVEPTGISYVGASNGSATVVDFTFLAQSKAAIAKVKTVVLLSGGEYTEAQSSITEHRVLYQRVPMLFVWAEDDTQSASWNATYEGSKAPAWQFWKYDGGDHGTELLTSKPESIKLIADFIDKKE